MSEYIDDLLVQAEANADEQTEGKEYNIQEWRRIYMIEFAKLIMEDTYILLVEETGNDETWPLFDDVKQHFGVK